MTLDAHPAAAAFPMMNDKRFAELKSSISERGLNHPILLHDGMILDGRNRYRACVELGVDPRFVEYAGNPYQRAWEENGQRRDLEDGARYLIWKRLSAMDSEWQEEQLRIQEEANRARAEAARTQHEVSTPRHGETLVVGPNVPPPKPKGHKSREAKAKKTNVTPATVKRADTLDKARPDLAQQVIAGDLTLSQGTRKMHEDKQREREAQRLEEIHAQADLHFDIRRGDFEDALADLEDGSVDLILTDPPYGDNATPLYGRLAAWAAKKLKPGGSLIAYTGQATLGDVINAMTPHLRYWWCIALTHSAGPQQMPGKWVQVRWKPILWFVNGSRTDRLYVDDVITGTPPRKDLHEWAQGLEEIKPLIDRLTEAGHLVVDPFAGSGTTGHAANDLGRHFLGADNGSHHDA